VKNHPTFSNPAQLLRRHSSLRLLGLSGLKLLIGIHSRNEKQNQIEEEEYPQAGTGQICPKAGNEAHTNGLHA
jgi:hypothetical protein